MPSVRGRARAFWVVGPQRGEIREVSLSPLGPQDVLVRTLHSGISRGTESLVFRGDVPPSEYERMRAPFQEGSFPAPVKYGYSNVGIVEAGPDRLMGRTVFALFPHQTHYVVPAEAVYELPGGVPARRALLAANLETAINAVWDARLNVGDRVAVVGGGAVGCLVAWLAGRLPGCSVQLIDVDPGRTDIARTLGVRFALPEQAEPDADVVLHASGSPEGLDLALRLAAFEARVVEVSWYGTKAVALSLGQAFHARRLTLTSSQVGSVATPQRSRWTPARRLRLALDLLTNPALDALLTHWSPFDSLPATMALAASSPHQPLCHGIDYD